MKRNILLDTGPLVALLNTRDAFHAWARDQFADIEPPLLTCDAIVVEACHLLRHRQAVVLEFLRRGVLKTVLDISQEASTLHQLLTRYSDLPMSLADACLVRMAEQNAGSTILTLDSDFRIYRMHGRRVIPCLLPPTRT